MDSAKCVVNGHKVIGNRIIIIIIIIIIILLLVIVITLFVSCVFSRAQRLY